MDPNAFKPSSDVTFVVRNNSSIKRSIKVFNTPILFGRTLDLMKIPGVTEEDIRSEMIKSSFKSLLAGGALVIVACTINTTTTDPNHQAFLDSIGMPGSNGSSSSNSSCLAQLIAPQISNVATGDHVAFNTATTVGSLIALNTASPYSSVNGAASIGRFTITSGHSYKCSSNIGLTDGFDFYWQWWDATNGVALTSSIGWIQSSTSPESAALVNSSYFGARASLLIELRIIFNNGVTTTVGMTTGDSIFISPWAIIDSI